MSVSNPRQMFSNPSIPFVGTILGGLLPGEMVLIQGSVPKGADRFQVDFTCGSSVKPRADVAFHFNPRFSKSCIVCNALEKERWGREEIHRSVPFRMGGDFEVLILVLKDQYKVAVNGAHLLAFCHRVDLDRVDTISISGKVRVTAVGILPPNATTNTTSPCVGPTNQDSEMRPLVSCSGDLGVPFTAPLDKGLNTGRSIVIKAEIDRNAQRFCVNLRSSISSDIALHLNPHLKKAVFVRNSFLCECWGPEETRLDSCFPFTAGQYFEMIVLSNPQHFRVAVNGLHLLDYKHRVQDLSQVDQLEIKGDVKLLDVQIL
ncbi:galectin-8-like [Pholidichthys leucotaenia]